ncbi:NADH-ubiquinone oxidoreductase-F iron-sulfur binding region domain-containing protein [Desulfotalea psychrophila]|nr:NADH-ubiquinone oxidoreductase-F iron-sulfur binding region domain-containing protein [Desulfotalea psychrophila]
MTIKEIRQQAEANWQSLIKGTVIYIGAATCGRSAGALKTKKAFETELAKQNVKAEIVEVGCFGPCYTEPLICIARPGKTKLFFQNVDGERAEELVTGYLQTGEIPRDYLFAAVPEDGIEREKELPYLDEKPEFARQKRILFASFGFTDPTNIEHYLVHDGYLALEKSLQEGPDMVLTEIKKSALRGRGGGGFPAARKWEAGRKATGHPKYVVCNADEGDPGAFMDRSVLEGDPHAVLEGMAIAGLTIGSEKGYIYVRAEYPLAIARLQNAIDQAKEKNLLGANILGTDFSFDIELFQGAGAFVCGESTALTQSIQGYRGMPKASPRPRTTDEGLFDKPTLLNNVKTFAYVPKIINSGGESFAAIGTEKSKGTAVFALTGMVKHCGLIEVPMGTTLREIVFELGGGMVGESPFKAIQSGGPSGGCLPAHTLDTPVDYDSLVSAGAMMGSGGLVVMDESTCMVDIARYFLDFTQKESCGQCTLCKLGTKQMLNILEDIVAGRGKEGDIELLLEVGEAVNAGSLCGLGKSAANPVLTTIKYFRDEYEAHIRDKACPACACKDLISFHIDPEKCTGCTACARACPVSAISGEKRQVHQIDQALCIRCGVCLEKCPKKWAAVSCIPGNGLGE